MSEHDKAVAVGAAAEQRGAEAKRPCYYAKHNYTPDCTGVGVMPRKDFWLCEPCYAKNTKAIAEYNRQQDEFYRLAAAPPAAAAGEDARDAAKWRAYCAVRGSPEAVAHDEALSIRLEANEQDAARYRFLRNADDSWVIEHWLPEPRGTSELLDGAQLDAAIDAALKQSQQPAQEKQ